MVTRSISSKIASPGPGISPTHQKIGGLDANINHVYRLLINRLDLYLTAKKGHWYTERLILTRPLISAALNGDLPLGLMSVSGTGTSRWCAWDADSDEQLPQLYALAQHLAPQGHVLLEKSRRGAHLFAFIRHAYWEQARFYGVTMAEEFGLEGIETYPKHGLPNSLRCPGTLHPKSGAVYPILDPATGEVISLETALASIAPIDIAYVDLPPVKPKNAIPASFGSPQEFEALVTELEYLTQVRVYAPERGVAHCIWHDDKHPSLFIKGSKFHCLSSRCGRWGDVQDLRRFVDEGALPPGP